MRQPVTVAAISKTVASTPINGAPVSDDRFPLKPHRSVRYFNSSQLERHSKAIEDRLDYVIDMSRWMEIGETVIAAVAYTTNDDVTLSQLEYSPTRVSVWIEGGTDDQRHTIDVTMQTSLGKVVTCLFILFTRDNPSPEVVAEYTGTHQNMLPHRHRQWRALNYRGFTQLDKHIKDTTEQLDYYLDLASVVNPDSEITDVVIWSDDPLLEMPYVYYEGTYIVAYIGAGTAGRRSVVEMLVNTSYGEQVSYQFVLELRNEPIDPSLPFVIAHGGVPEDVPVRKDRTIPYGGSLSVPRWRKLSKETLEYTIDLNNWLEYNSALTAAFAYAGTGGLRIPKLLFTDSKLIVWLSGGADLKEFVVLIELQVDNLITAVMRMQVRTTGMSGDEAIITIDNTTVNVAQVAQIVPQPPEPVPQPIVTASPSMLNYPATFVGSQSAAQYVTVTNTGEVNAFLRSVHITGQYRYLIAPNLRMEPGDSFQVAIRFEPQAQGAAAGKLQLDFGSGLVDMVSMMGTGQSAAALASWSDDSIDFGNAESGSTGEQRTITLVNTGNLVMNITSITASGDFEVTSAIPSTLAVGDSLAIDMTFTPTTTGARSGTLTLVAPGAGGTKTIPLSGTGTVVTLLKRLSTSGNQFVTPVMAPVRLKSVNWFGMESENYTPHGTWGRAWKGILDQIKAMGFNCVRIPFSGDATTSGRTPPPEVIDTSSNADLVGLTSLAILDKYIAYCMEIGLYVVLDHHRRTAGAGTQGSPIDATYTLASWKATWEVMANRYKDAVNVVGADVHNEPHDLTWNVWAGYAEECGNAIHAIAPDWIIFVEGVGSYAGSGYWWGGQLQGVADRPVSLLASNRLAYSPHEYGQSVGVQTWLAYDGQTPPAGWPDNLFGVWTPNWGFIFEQNIAPIWIGEFGGKYGVNGSGVVDAVTAPHGAYEKQWTQNLMAYINGDFTGDGSNDLPVGKVGMSFSYWSLNPNSTDTGGLLQDDFITPQATKLTLLSPLLGG